MDRDRGGACECRAADLCNRNRDREISVLIVGMSSQAIEIERYLTVCVRFACSVGLPSPQLTVTALKLFTAGLGSARSVTLEMTWFAGIGTPRVTSLGPGNWKSMSWQPRSVFVVGV